MNGVSTSTWQTKKHPTESTSKSFILDSVSSHSAANSRLRVQKTPKLFTNICLRILNWRHEEVPSATFLLNKTTVTELLRGQTKHCLVNNFSCDSPLACCRSACDITVTVTHQTFVLLCWHKSPQDAYGHIQSWYRFGCHVELRASVYWTGTGCSKVWGSKSNNAV